MHSTVHTNHLEKKTLYNDFLYLTIDECISSSQVYCTCHRTISFSKLIRLGIESEILRLNVTSPLMHYQGHFRGK